MFEQEKQQLRELLQKQRCSQPSSAEYSHSVRLYNEILDDMIERGLRQPLPEELLLDPTLLSEKYSKMEEQWEHAHPCMFEQFIKRCSYIYLVEVKEVGSHTLTAKVMRDYRTEKSWWQRWPRTVEIKYYIPWGFDKWFTPGERSIVFLDDKMISRGIPGRMPLVERDGLQFVVSYQENRDFWPQNVDVVPSTFEGAQVYLVEWGAIEEIITEYFGHQIVGHRPATAPQGVVYK